MRTPVCVAPGWRGRAEVGTFPVVTHTLLELPARYVPVRPVPLRMQAGLRKFPEGFGNGDADGRIFQKDREFGAYIAAKRTAARPGGRAPRARAWSTDAPGDAKTLRAVLAWCDARARGEVPGYPGCGVEIEALEGSAALADAWDRFAVEVQEDLAVIRLHEDGTHRLICGHVCFPSGWRPERLVGASFDEIHRPVPDFADDPRASTSMTRSMVMRGPYVRFVWTVSADDVLDHHPEDGMRAPIPGAQRLWLRVERQLTVPFAGLGASLFVIRTYRYPLASLSVSQRQDLARAMETMPERVAAYKGLAAGRAHILASLASLASVD